MKRLSLAFTSALVVLVAAAGGVSARPGALPRATEDQPDDQRGPQIHFMYAVPADGEDRGLDTSGAIGRSAGMFTRWLASETGGPTLRVDTYKGEIDVTFVQLRQTDAQLAARGAFVRNGIEEELRERGLATKPDRIYDVYYDGTSTYSCGGAFWPPQIQGNVVAMYLRGLPGGPVPCERNRVGEGLGYWEFAMLHDTLHGLGLVATCAPNHTRFGHASDSPNDLMWAGDAPWQLPPKLDIGRDDYYGHGRGDCPDLATSPYLTSNASPPPTLELSLAVGRARAGKRFEVRAHVLVDAAAPANAVVTCAASLGTARLRWSSGYAAGTARCRWTLPKTARGKRLNGSITVRAEGLAATRSFRVRVA